MMKNSSSLERMDQETACAFLYREHVVELLHLSRQRGIDEHEAQDLVQELFLRVFHLGLIRVLAERHVQVRRVWLVRTLRWMILNQHRHRSRQRRGGGMTLESLNKLMEAGFDPADGKKPDEIIDKRCLLAALNQRLENLKNSTKHSKWRMIESLLCDQGDPNRPGKERVARHRVRMFLRNHLMMKSDAILRLVE